MFIGEYWFNEFEIENTTINGYAFFRDEDLYLYSPIDGVLGIVADGAVKIGDATTNYAGFDPTGHLTFNAAARPWRDEIGELVGMKKKGVRITEDLDEGTVVFSNACQIADDWIVVNVQLNHDKDLTASIYPHLHWFQETTYKPNWLLKYRWQVNGGSKIADWTSITLSHAVFTFSGITLNQISSCSEIAVPVGSTLSDIVQFKIMRDTDNDSGLFTGNDAVTGNVAALMFDCHFMLNSCGSTDEYTK